MTTELPASPQAEVALLASVLFAPKRIGKIADIVQPDDFYVPANRVVAQVLWDLWQDNAPIDPVMVYDALCKRKQDTVVGGHEGLMRIADSVPETSHATHYAEIVCRKAALRKLIVLCQETQRQATRSEDVDAIVVDAVDGLRTIVDRAEHRDVQPIGAVAKEVIEHLQDPDKTMLWGYRTQFMELNRVIGGFAPGTLTILGGFPSHGKSTLALNIVEHLLTQGIPCGMFSLEMTYPAIAKSMLSSMARVDLHGNLELPDNKLRLMAQYERMLQFKFVVDPSACVTPAELRIKARRMRDQHGIEFLVVDHIQRIAEGEGGQTAERRVAEGGNACKEIAKTLEIPVLCLSQLTTREGSRDVRDALPKWSRQLREDADTIILIDSEPPIDTEGREVVVDDADLYVVKHRDGRTGHARIPFYRSFLHFGNYPEDGDSDPRGREPNEDPKWMFGSDPLSGEERK